MPHAETVDFFFKMVRHCFLHICICYKRASPGFPKQLVFEPTNPLHFSMQDLDEEICFHLYNEIQSLLIHAHNVPGLRSLIQQ